MLLQDFQKLGGILQNPEIVVSNKKELIMNAQLYLLGETYNIVVRKRARGFMKIVQTYGATAEEAFSHKQKLKQIHINAVRNNTMNLRTFVRKRQLRLLIWGCATIIAFLCILTSVYVLLTRGFFTTSVFALVLSIFLFLICVTCKYRMICDRTVLGGLRHGGK